MRKAGMLGLAAMVALASSAQAQNQQGTTAGANAKLIASALSAGPKEITANATVMTFDANGKMIVLRKGTNDWTCVPDDPHTPGNDPICADKSWMQWFDAWMAHKPPMVKQLGIAYMLQGGSDASNTDPFAEKPAAGQSWVTTPAHMMILLPDPKQLESYPAAVSPGAFIMFKGTPYAHLMLPVPR